MKVKIVELRQYQTDILSFRWPDFFKKQSTYPVLSLDLLSNPLLGTPVHVGVAVRIVPGYVIAEGVILNKNRYYEHALQIMDSEHIQVT